MKHAMTAEDIGLLETLLQDWENGQDILVKQLLRLEVHGDDPDLIDDLFDRIHRIKRGASYVGLTPVTMMTDEIESVLRALRAGRIGVDANLIDQLLSISEVLADCIRQFGRGLKDRGTPGDNGEFTIALDVGDRWHDAKQKLHEICASEGRNESNPTIPASGAMDSGTREMTQKSREQFLFEIYADLDRMTNGCFRNLSQNENDRDAVNELLWIVRHIKAGLETYDSIVSVGNVHPAILDVLPDAVSRFEKLLELVRDKKQPFRKAYLDLGQEMADNLKAALDSVALGEEIPGCREDLPDRIERELGDLANVQTTAMDGETPFPAAGDDSSALPVHKAALPQSIRVSQDKLDMMMNMISELLIAKNGFGHLSTKLNMEYDLPELSKEVKEVGLSINRISDELQNAVMSIRMIEVKTVFQRMPRIIRDVAQATGKKIELVMTGENTEIDKTIVELISDPIIHLIRNAADHGIEHPNERLEKGKRETGKIALRAYNKDKHVYIEIEDDGKGINAEDVKRKALERGFIAPEAAEAMTKNQLVNLIFLPGFSTASQITEVSGRGVGMDIVRKNIEKTGGSISIDSEVDRGTKMTIRLPLTIAISRGLAVDVSHETYIIPIDHIAETVKIKSGDIYEYNGKHFALHKGEVIGVEWLAKLFMLDDGDREKDELNAVILSNGAEKFGLIVDRLKNEQEFVIKPLGGHLAGIPGISGSTLLGDGRVVLIVNPIDLIKMANG